MSCSSFLALRSLSVDISRCRISTPKCWCTWKISSLADKSAQIRFKGKKQVIENLKNGAVRDFFFVDILGNASHVAPTFTSHIKKCSRSINRWKQSRVLKAVGLAVNYGCLDIKVKIYLKEIHIFISLTLIWSLIWI